MKVRKDTQIEISYHFYLSHKNNLVLTDAHQMDGLKLKV